MGGDCYKPDGIYTENDNCLAKSDDCMDCLSGGIMTCKYDLGTGHMGGTIKPRCVYWMYREDADRTCPISAKGNMVGALSDCPGYAEMEAAKRAADNEKFMKMLPVIIVIAVLMIVGGIAGWYFKRKYDKKKALEAEEREAKGLPAEDADAKEQEALQEVQQEEIQNYADKFGLKANPMMG